MSDDIDPALQERMATLRPRLHRYCARMVGSTIDGEDLVQDAMVKALRALGEGADVKELQAWLFRIGHNTCLDFIRARQRVDVIPIDDEIEDEPPADPQTVSIGFSAFLRLPELQRCAVVLKDVLGHSTEEVAAIAECSPAAAKSALQRGRAALRRIAAEPQDMRVPLMSSDDRERLAAYVGHFKSGDFDALRALLAGDVKLELVNRLRLQGQDKVGIYFTRYAEEPRWRYALGAVEGRPAMLVFDRHGDPTRPAHWAMVDFVQGRVQAIRDYLFAPYAMLEAEWVSLE